MVKMIPDKHQRPSKFDKIEKKRKAKKSIKEDKERKESDTALLPTCTTTIPISNHVNFDGASTTMFFHFDPSSNGAS